MGDVGTATANVLTPGTAGQRRARRLKAVGLAPAVVSGGDVDLDDVVEVAASAVRVPLAVFDGQLRLVAHSAADIDDRDWCHAVVSRSAARAGHGLLTSADLRRLLTASGPVVLDVSGRHVVTAVRADGHIAGILAVHGAGGVAAATRTVAEVGDLLRRALVARLDGGAVQRRARLLASLLDERDDGAELGVDGIAAWRVVAFDSACEATVHGVLRTTLSQLGVPVTSLRGRTYALLADASTLRSRLSELARQLDARLAVGAVFRDAAGAAVSRRSADDLLDAGLEVAWADDEPERLLLAAISRALAGRDDLKLPALQTLVHHDERTGADYLGTIDTWLHHDGDALAAAAALGLHPNTVRYRLRRVREVSGLDLDDPTVRLATTIALRCGLARGADHQA